MLSRQALEGIRQRDAGRMKQGEPAHASASSDRHELLEEVDRLQAAWQPHALEKAVREAWKCGDDCEDCDEGCVLSTNAGAVMARALAAEGCLDSAMCAKEWENKLRQEAEAALAATIATVRRTGLLSCDRCAVPDDWRDGTDGTDGVCRDCPHRTEGRR